MYDKCYIAGEGDRDSVCVSRVVKREMVWESYHDTHLSILSVRVYM